MDMYFEEKASQLGKHLLTHAKSIYRYACTYSAPIYSNSLRENALKKQFARTVSRLVEEMNMLIALADFKGIGNYCNMEMIEAYTQAATDLIEAPSQPAVVFN